MKNKTVTAATSAPGLIASSGAYLIWGLLPLFWKLLGDLGSDRILCHRILWSTLVLCPLVFIFKRNDLKRLFLSPRLIATMTLTGILLGTNWVTYIYAVNTGRVLDASMGYYINPLVSVLLGTIFLKERLTKPQIGAVIIASAGVMIQMTELETFPWISLVLAGTFGLYGLIRKTADVSPLSGLFTETLMVAPVALIWLLVSPGTQNGVLETGQLVLLILIGPLTVIPLLLFNFGAKRITLSALGFLQYIAPSLMFLIGRFVYHESLTPIKGFGFLLIWTALAIFLGTGKRKSRG